MTARIGWVRRSSKQLFETRKTSNKYRRIVRKVKDLDSNDDV